MKRPGQSWDTLSRPPRRRGGPQTSSYACHVSIGKRSLRGREQSHLVGRVRRGTVPGLRSPAAPPGARGVWTGLGGCWPLCSLAVAGSDRCAPKARCRRATSLCAMGNWRGLGGGACWGKSVTRGEPGSEPLTPSFTPLCFPPPLGKSLLRHPLLPGVLPRWPWKPGTFPSASATSGAVWW